MRLKLQAVASEGSQQEIMSSEHDSDSSSSSSSDDPDDDPDAFVVKKTMLNRSMSKRKNIISDSVGGSGPA